MSCAPGMWQTLEKNELKKKRKKKKRKTTPLLVHRVRLRTKEK